MQPLKSLTLRQNFSWTFVGNIVYAASQWGMLVVLAKLGSPEMVGQFTLGLAVTAPIILFSNLQLRQIQTTDVKQQYTFGDYLGLRLLCLGLALPTIAIVTIKAGYRWETSLTILIIGLSKVLESISDIFHGLFQYHERMDRIAISLMIKGPLSLLMLGIGIRISGSVVGGAIGLAVIWALVAIFYDIPSGAKILRASALGQKIEASAKIADRYRQPTIPNRQLPPKFKLPNLHILVGIGLAAIWALVAIFDDTPSSARILKSSALGQRIEASAKISDRHPQPTIPNRQLQPRFNLPNLRSLVGLSLPLGFVMMLISLNANIPRYFIEHHLGERELGIFSALSYLMVAGGIVVSALGQSASPRLAKYYAAGNEKDFKNLLLKTVLIGTVLGGLSILAAAVAGKEMLTILYRPEYAQHVYLFILLMVAAGIGYVASFLGYGMTAAQYFRVQMPLFTIVTAISALVCYLLVPTQGLIGAAIALIVGAIVQAIFSLGVIFHALHKLKKDRHPTESNSID